MAATVALSSSVTALPTADRRWVAGKTKGNEGEDEAVRKKKKKSNIMEEWCVGDDASDETGEESEVLGVLIFHDDGGGYFVRRIKK